MPMPYAIQSFPGPGGEPRPYKVYSETVNCPASEEEVKVWEHVKDLERQVEAARKKGGKP
jgi:hypothetical protein